jgi:hypothetical protein
LSAARHPWPALALLAALTAAACGGTGADDANRPTADASRTGFDAEKSPADAAVSGLDARRAPSADVGRPPDADAAGTPAPDAVVGPQLDAALGPEADAARVPEPDATLAPAPDAALAPEPDAARGPEPDAALAPEPDAARGPKSDAALVPEPDAARGPEPDAALAPEPDAARGPEPDAALVPEADAALAPDPDAFAPPPDLAPERDCTALTPVLAFGVFVAPGAAGLDVQPRFGVGPEPPAPRRAFDFEAGEAPAGLTARTTPDTLGAASVFQALRDAAAGACRLIGVDVDAGPVWAADAADVLDCAGPTAAADVVLWPVTTRAGEALRVLDADTGALLDEVTLPLRATTAPVFVGGGPDPRANGGSHWLIGGVDGLLVLRGLDGIGPAEVVGLSPVAGEVSAVAAAASTVGPDAPVDAAVALLRRAPDDEGFGRGLARFDVGADGALTPRADVDLGAPARTPPVLALDCPDAPGGPIDPLANGGSHWWCPGGLVAVGQDGALRAYAFDTGALDREIPLNPALRPTGLTLGRDDRFYNGGSHWRGGMDGFFSLSATDPVAGHPATLAAGPAPVGTCIPAPVLDSDGALSTFRVDPAGEALPLRFPTDSGGEGVGFTRPGGDTLGSGRPRSSEAPCPGGDVLLTSGPVATLAGLEVFDAVSLPDGGRVITADEVDRPGRAPTLVRVTAGGRIVWRRTFPDGAGRTVMLGGLVYDPPADRVFATGGTFSLAVGLEGPTVVSVRTDGSDPRSTVIADGGHPRGVGLMPTGDGGLRLFVASVDTGDTDLVTLDATLTETGRDPFPTLRNRTIAASRAVGPGGEMLVLTHDAVTRFSPAGAVLAEYRPAPPPLPVSVERQALTVDSAGGLLVAGTVNDGVGGISYFVEALDANLGRAGGEVIPDIDRVQGLAFGPDGASAWLFSNDMKLLRLTPGGAAAPPVRVPGGNVRTLGVALSLDAAGRPQVIANTLLADRQTRAPLLAQADFDGRTSCGVAGRCVGRAADACSPADACQIGRCEPESGACVFEPLPDGAPCGARRSCLSGACQ